MEILGVLLALRRDGQDDDDVVVQDFPVYTLVWRKKVWCRKNCVGNVPNGFVWGFGFG